MGNSEAISSLDQRLGRRIGEVRRQQGLTLDALAERAGVSRATLSRIERGETSPTAHVLGALCGVFGLTLSRLLLGIEETAPALMRADRAPVWEDPETGFRRTVIAPPVAGYAVEIIRGELPAGARIPYDRPPVMGLEHHVVGLSGGLLLTVAGETHRIGPGDCLRYRLTGPSGFESPGPEPAVYLVIVRMPS